jgi:hypothetical protein
MDVFDYNLKGYAVSLYRLLTAPILPMDFTPMADTFTARLGELAEVGKGVIDLNDLVRMSKELAGKAQTLKSAVQSAGSTDKAPLINAILIKLSRILLPIGYTYWGVYEQDLYGAEYLSKPLPGLYWVDRLAGLPKDSEDFAVYETRLVRERNKIHDALREAGWFMDYLLERL